MWPAFLAESGGDEYHLAIYTNMVIPKSNNKEKQTLSLGEVANALAPFGVRLSDAQLLAIARYVELLLIWNQSLDLTTICDPVEVVSRHFGESIFAASVIPMHFGRLADVGSGAGFPGMPLKIAFPDLNVALLEPNRKKCAFLAEVKGELGLAGVDIVRSGYEEFFASSQRFDFICSRALGNYRRLLRWARTVLGSEGCVILWLGVDDSVIVARTRDWRWEIPVSIPESRRRVLLVGRPVI